MTDTVGLVLALALGLVIGVVVGARAGLRLAERRRAALGTSAQLARLWPSQLPQRSAADILAGVIRVQLGGQPYQLPVLPRGAARDWLGSLDRRFAALGQELEKAGNDTPAIMARLVAEADGLLDMLIDYDRAGASLLPDRATLDEVATNTEILRAVVEVWRAVNPLADTLVASASVPSIAGTEPGQLITPRARMAGDHASSSASPTSSSSPTSMPRRSVSSASRARSSSGSSRPSASAPASSTTAVPTAGGERSSARRPRSRPGTAGA